MHESTYHKIASLKSGLVTLVAAVLLVSGVGMVWAATNPEAVSGSKAQTQDIRTADASSLFADAPDGVDPIVTGPSSQGLKKRQLELNCGSAKWPNIPTACYPN